VSYSNYTEDAVNNAICNNTAFQVAQSYVKLHLGDPGEDGTANAAAETTRKAASFGASSGGTATSDADLTWTSYAAAETVTHISLWDNSTAGNCLGAGALTASKTLAIGDTFVIPTGSLTVTTT
jgi:hypothetical protein